MHQIGVIAMRLYVYRAAALEIDVWVDAMFVCIQRGRAARRPDK